MVKKYVINAMQGRSILHCRPSFGFRNNTDGRLKSEIFFTASRLPCCSRHAGLCALGANKRPLFTTSKGLDFMKLDHTSLPAEIKVVATNSHGELSDEDDELCPVECVKEFRTGDEFTRILEKANKTSSLVVVDFYRRSCGSCKYIEQGFAKLCRGSGDEEASVIFLKHNVMDEYDEPSEFAEQLRVKVSKRHEISVQCYYYW